MPRFHLKRVAIAGFSVLLICLGLILVQQYHQSRPYYRGGVPDVDPELWKLLGAPETSSQNPVTRPVPKVHLKQILQTQTISNKWPIQKVEDFFFRFLENKAAKCEKDVRLGNWNDGGWNVCMSSPFQLRSPCVVFSFGIGNDWQFDDSISNSYGCRVIAFDPSMEELVVPRSSLITFRKIGLGAINGVGKNGWRLKTLKQHIKDEGLWGAHIDYVKIDVEFMEWEILNQASSDGVFKFVKQLGFEVHTPELFRIFSNGRNMTKHDSKAEKIDFINMFKTLRQIENIGFRKFNYRKNPFGNYNSFYTGQERSCCYELHYINAEYLMDNNTVIHEKDSSLFHR